MNARLVIVPLIFLPLSILAQGTGVGTIFFSNVSSPLDKRVYVITDPSVPPMQGVLAAGTAYAVACYWSLPEANQWMQVGSSVSFLTGTAAGCFFGATRTITGLPQNGAVIDVQVRGWATAYGSNWEQVMNYGAVGQSPILTLRTRNPADPFQDSPVLGQQPAWTAWAITIPEPSVVALGLLGVGICFLLFRPRHRPSRL